MCDSKLNVGNHLRQLDLYTGIICEMHTKRFSNRFFAKFFDSLDWPRELEQSWESWRALGPDITRELTDGYERTKGMFWVSSFSHGPIVASWSSATGS